MMIDDPRNGSHANTESLCEYLLGNDIGNIGCPDRNNVVLCKFNAWVLFSWRRMTCLHLILHIVSGGTYVEMIRVDTRGIVALMADKQSFRNIAIVNLITNAMSKERVMVVSDNPVSL
jgi:hypothetical protein